RRCTRGGRGRHAAAGLHDWRAIPSIQIISEIAMSVEVEWARMTAPELRGIATREGALAILPAGSLEQHGPHLPVITDTASASAAAIAAARLGAAEAVPGAGRR